MFISHIYILCVCVPVCSDLTVGPEGACIIPGLLRPEKGLQAEESGNHLGAEKGGVPEIGKPA